MTQIEYHLKQQYNTMTQIGYNVQMQFFVLMEFHISLAAIPETASVPIIPCLKSIVG